MIDIVIKTQINTPFIVPRCAGVFSCYTIDAKCVAEYFHKIYNNTVVQLNTVLTYDGDSSHSKLY